MNEIWFCYTMLFILMCLFSASMSLSAYFVSHRTTYLGIIAFFIAFCLETSLIFLDEYSYLKPDTLAEIVTFPFLHPWIKLAFSTLFIMSVWWVVLEYVERRTWLRIAVPCGACVLVQAAVVVAVLLEGKDNQNIASALTLSLGTVKAHVHNIYRKANVSSRQQLLQSFWKED